MYNFQKTFIKKKEHKINNAQELFQDIIKNNTFPFITEKAKKTNTNLLKVIENTYSVNDFPIIYYSNIMKPLYPSEINSIPIDNDLLCKLKPFKNNLEYCIKVYIPDNYPIYIAKVKKVSIDEIPKNKKSLLSDYSYVLCVKIKIQNLNFNYKIKLEEDFVEFWKVYKTINKLLKNTI